LRLDNPSTCTMGNAPGLGTPGLGTPKKKKLEQGNNTCETRPHGSLKVLNYKNMNL